MLIEIDRLQPELKIILVEPGTKKRITSTKNVQLVITHPPQSEAVPLTKIIRTGDWGYPPLTEENAEFPPDYQAYPAIVYPAFGVDDNEALIFRLDFHFWRRPCGRYHATVYVDNYVAISFEIELNPHTFVATQVETKNLEDCS